MGHAFPRLDVNVNDGHDHQVGGWLLLLCLFLAIWQPINLAMAASTALSALPVRGYPLALLLAARVVVTAFGVAAALAIYHRQSRAVIMAGASLVLSACAEVFVYTTSYFPSNRPPGDTPWYIAWSIASHAVWLVYVFKSARVRRTLG
jgi:hypothetical protein